MFMKSKFNNTKPIIGVVHLDPLPGSPKFNSLEEVRKRAIEDSKKLEDGGIDAMIVENYGDNPFKKKVGDLTVSAMTDIIGDIKKEIKKPIGINVLRNDWEAALSIANVLKLDFIRVNVYSGVSLTGEGIIEGEAADIQRFKDIHDIEVDVMADIQVKHGKKLYPKGIQDEALEVTERGLADQLIISGKRTSQAPNIEDLKSVKNTVNRPVLIGSGLTLNNIEKLLPFSDGAIVGTHIKKEENTSNEVSLKRVRSLMDAVKEIR